MDLLLTNTLINLARTEAEKLCPLDQAPPEVDGEPGREMLVRFPAKGGYVAVRVDEYGTAHRARFERSLWSKLLRP